MVEQLLNSLLFYFFSDVEKRSATRRILRDPYFVGIFFFIFWGHFGVTNERHSRSALYRAENIRDQLFV